MPATPLSRSNYRYNNSVEQSYQLTGLKYEVEYLEYSKKYIATLHFDGKKLYDYRGSGQSASLKIGWKLYKGDAVVQSGTCYTPAIASGEAFSDTTESIYNLTEGNYRLEIMNIN